jgi:hypothetical protein
MRHFQSTVAALAMGGLAAVVLAGCGGGAPTGPVSSSPDDGAALELADGSEIHVGEGQTSGPSAESALVAGPWIVGRLLEAAFYADGASFLAGLVSPGAYDRVADVLAGRMDELRWAIATVPGETERAWFVSAPLTAEVVGLDERAGTAVVEVWIVTVFSRLGLGVPESRFMTATAGLRWEDGQWLISDLGFESGPSAALAFSEVPATAADLDGRLAGHQLLTIEVDR